MEIKFAPMHPIQKIMRAIVFVIQLGVIHATNRLTILIMISDNGCSFRLRYHNYYLKIVLGS